MLKYSQSHPTSTMYCPSPSSGMECGYDSNTIAPLDQGEDFSIEHAYSPEDCQQVCLEHSACKAYRVVGGADNGWYCEIFNVGLGKGGSNMVAPTPHGSQWWDRNCQAHIPTGCRSGPVQTGSPMTATPSSAQPTPFSSSAAPSQPITAPAPTPTISAAVKLAKRDAPFPDYFADLSYYYSSIYVTPACSCMISSALAPTSSVTTSTHTAWRSIATVYSTYEDYFVYTTTPRSTTVYSSIN